MNKANKLRGYYEFPIGEGKTKTMHFSMNFVCLLQQIVEEDLTVWVAKLDKLDHIQQGLALSQLVFSGLAAYDQEEGNEIDYNVYKIRDWLYNALREDKNLAIDLLKVMTDSFNDVGKTKPKVK